MKMKSGYTTGACAAAATFAASRLLKRKGVPSFAILMASTRTLLHIPILESGLLANGPFAAVRKDAGDDDDVTHGAIVKVHLEPRHSGGIQFSAGKGVGTVTKQGLSIRPGEPAINPGPRKMIRRVLYDAGISNVLVTISIDNGVELAKQTFNSRLGVEGGLSVLGTTGIVRPKCRIALKRTIELSIAVANGEHPGELYMVPGNIGAGAATKQFDAVPCQIVEVENLWGFAIDAIPASQKGWIHIVGHPGKLLKLAKDDWNTHSSCSEPATSDFASSASKLGFPVPAKPNTCEEIVQILSRWERWVVCRIWCNRISKAVFNRLRMRNPHCKVSVFVTLVTMGGEVAGSNAPCGKEKNR